MNKNNLIINKSVHYAGILKDVKKNQADFLVPLYEVFTNALESIKLGAKHEKFNSQDCYIKIKLYLLNQPDIQGNENILFHKLVVEDNGIGFDNDNFDRFNMYKDDRKGFNNRGSGRLQLLHYFRENSFDSCYEQEGNFYKRAFKLSKDYLEYGSAIIYAELPEVVTEQERKTIITLSKLYLEKDRDSYSKLELCELKEKIFKRYLMEFCIHKN